MTFEESMDRLKERHEALAQSVELLLAETRELRVTAEQHNITAEQHNISLQRDSEHIHALVRIAEAHERRISRLEGDEPTN